MIITVKRFAGMKRIDKRRIEELRKLGRERVSRGSWGERESHEEAGAREEAGEEPAEVDWTCGKNGREWLMKRADLLSMEGRKRRRSLNRRLSI